jgi:hypothetical protein
MSLVRWIVPATVTAHNRRLEARLQMSGLSLKTWKVLKALLISVAVLSFAGLTILEGAEPTTVGVIALLLVAMINGIDVVEVVAVLADVRQETQQSTDDESDNGDGGGS